jgi:protein TonB
METNKILTANLLDIIFDDRNKDYGAYELRKTYPKQITKALLVTGTITLLIFGSLLARSSKPENNNNVVLKSVVLTDITEKPEPEIPRPERRQETVQTRTQIFTPPTIVENVENPIPPQEDLANAKIDVVTKDGRDDGGIVDGNVPVDDKGIIDVKKNAEPDIWTIVEVDAKFTGNWKAFLERNLNANIPVDNAAPAGNYPIDVQFVVDTNGIVSDIKPLTNLGYGMEQEAVRVLKKATKWEPAIQNGRKVKAYRRQRITFQVMSDE